MAALGWLMVVVVVTAEAIHEPPPSSSNLLSGHLLSNPSTEKPEIALHSALPIFVAETKDITILHYDEHVLAGTALLQVSAHTIPRGGAGLSSLIPAGYNPLGYKITELGTQFLEFEGSLDSDIGRFLASLKSRKRHAALKEQWLEIVRVSKTGQTMRIYRTMDDMIAFCLKARLLD